MRTVRIMLTLALTLLLATTVMAQGRGKGGKGGGGGGGFMGAGGGRGMDITRLVEKLTPSLSDTEKAAVKAVQDKFGDKIKEAQKDAALTEDQQKAMKEAFQEARDKNIARDEMMKFIQDKVKRTEKQVEAQKKSAELGKEQMTELRAALSDANKAKLDELLKAGRGPGTRKAKDKAA